LNKRTRLKDFVLQVLFNAKYTKIKHRNKLWLLQHRAFKISFSLGENCVNFQHVVAACSFISSVQFVVIAVVVVFFFISDVFVSPHK